MLTWDWESQISLYLFRLKGMAIGRLDLLYDTFQVPEELRTSN